MNLEIDTRDNVSIVRLDGRLDAAAAGEIKNQIGDLADNASANVVMNLAKVDFIDSTGLGLIVSTYRRLRENEHDLLICELTPQARTLFELTRMHRIFTIFDGEAEALESCA